MQRIMNIATYDTLINYHFFLVDLREPVAKQNDKSNTLTETCMP